MRGFSGAKRCGIDGRRREGPTGRSSPGRSPAWRFTCLRAPWPARRTSPSPWASRRGSRSTWRRSKPISFGLVILSLMLLATITAVLHLVGRRTGTRRVLELETEIARTNAKLDRAALMLRSEPQILVSWDRLDAEPTIEGDFALVPIRQYRRGCSPSARGSIRPGGQDRRGDKAIAGPGRSIRRRRGQLARPPSRTRRAPSVRQRGNADPRRLGRALFSWRNCASHSLRPRAL